MGLWIIGKLCQLSSWIHQQFSLSLVDELFKEGNIKSNGIVNYKEFTQMVTLPPVDYWSPLQRKEALSYTTQLQFLEYSEQGLQPAAALIRQAAATYSETSDCYEEKLL